MQSQDTRYNGWRNYETWAVNLWLSNDAGLYEHVRAMASESSNNVHELAGRLRGFVQDGEMAPDLGASLYSDLLNAALSEVDWTEIATSWLEAA